MKVILFILTFSLLIIVLGCSSEETIISPQKAKSMLDSDEFVILVDVRTLEEYKEIRIPGALLLPVDNIKSQASAVIPDKKATYILYCRTGRRSADAASILKNMGYKNVYDAGGIYSWPYDTISG